MRPIALLALVAALATAGAVAARGAATYPCDPTASPGPYAQQPPPTPDTVFVMDGDLYAIVGASRGGLVGGWSGPPVLSFDGAFHWAKALGYGARIFSAKEIVGGTFSDGGSRSIFSFECRGTYRARVVVRLGRDPVRLALVAERGVTRIRAFHTPPLRLPLGAVLEVRFSHPLARRAPTLLVDRNADRRWDRRIVFRTGVGDLGVY